MKTLLSNIPVWGWIAGGILAVAISYSLIFFIPKTITFSYAQQTCVGQLTFAPQLHKASSDDFDIELEDSIKIGGVSLISTQLCVTPKKTLQEGTVAATVSPFGGWIAQKNFAIKVPTTPVAQVSDLSGKTISTAEPLEIALSGADVIHQYSLAIADKAATCTQAKGQLSCDVAKLDLAHGTTYTASLYQSFKEVERKLAEGKVETLQPLRLTDSSVKDGQVIYDAPEVLSFTFDQSVEKADVTLVKITGETTEEVKATSSTEGAVLKLAVPKLGREATYRLNVAQAVAESGSSLAEPIIVNFQTSGGPKVASVSVGNNSVARNATITVTFDQPIAEDVDITKFARIEGVAGSVRKVSPTQLHFAIQGGDCTGFTLFVAKGVKSGSNGEVSKDDWKFASRTICGYSWNIGTSVKGRAITAYSFGSGSKTILFTGGIHGSEPSSTTTMQAWVKHLQAYAGDLIPADKRIVVVPNTNPDGIAAGSRYNANNVNLGRNFPTKNWSASIETSSGVLSNGGGTAPGSEPEAAALIKLVRQLKPRLAISYHAQGRLVGANKFADSVAIGDIYAKTVGYKTMYYNAEDVMGYAMTGEMEDWMGEEMNIPAILIELPTHSGNYLNAQMNALKKMLAI